MLNSLKSLLAPSNKPAKTRSAKLQCETLETRWVPASIGITKQAIIDFDGEAVVTQAQFAQGGWSLPTQSITSFNAIFNSTTPQLDMNGDGLLNNTDRAMIINTLDLSGNGVVNSTDASIARNQIMAKVRQDFAPYRISINTGDQDTFQGILTDGDVGDVMVIVNGAGGGFVPGFANVAGVAPLDANNDSDEMAFVFGGNIALTNNNPASFINNMARSISHEMAHTFGLDHITSTSWGDSQQHNLMNAPVDVNGDGDTSDVGEDQRDFSRDFGFQDVSFSTGSGTQNSHQILSREDVLGVSTTPWVAVLRSGELTVSGGSGSDNVRVRRLSASQWRVTTNGTATVVDLNSNGFNTLNTFDAAINRVKVLGQGGNDRLEVETNMTAPSTMFGGTGNDTMFGGNGIDSMLGGSGNDRMFGRNGNDRMFGESGTDRLEGGAGNDRLDGGDDWNADTLVGGSGNDTFLQNWLFWPFAEESILDEDASGNDTVIWV